MSSLYQHSCKVATVKGWAMYRQIPSSVKKTDRLAPLSIHGCEIVRVQAGKTWRLLRYQQGTTGNKDRWGSNGNSGRFKSMAQTAVCLQALKCMEKDRGSNLSDQWRC